MAVCCVSMQKALGLIPQHQGEQGSSIPCHTSILEVEVEGYEGQIQGHSLLHNELGASLGYVTTYLKNQSKTSRLNKIRRPQQDIK